MTTRTLKDTTVKTTKPVTKVVAPKVPARQEPNIKFSEYVADAKVRWNIHQTEVEALAKDLKAFYATVRPNVIKAYEYCVMQYRRFRPVPAQ